MCNLLHYTVVPFVQWLGLVFFGLHYVYFSTYKLYIFGRDTETLKILFNFINISEYIVDFADISKSMHRTCTLAQSHRLAWLLESTGVNLRAPGVNGLFKERLERNICKCAHLPLFSGKYTKITKREKISMRWNECVAGKIESIRLLLPDEAEAKSLHISVITASKLTQFTSFYVILSYIVPVYLEN